jgi:hypothetical protein
MTSIEWLFDQLWGMSKDKLAWHSKLEYAKELHKQEIIDAYSNGRDKWRLYEIEKQDSDSIKIPTPNQYYQETFVSKGSSEVEIPKQDILTGYFESISKYIHESLKQPKKD